MLSSDEPPIREFADRGTLWLLELPENLHDLLRLVSKEVAERLDFTRAERINRSFVPDDLRKQEADILYRVPYRQGRAEVWVYVLLEHQSRPDRTMGLRLLSYMVQIWDSQMRGFADAGTPVGQRKLSAVIPMVFYTGRRRWSSPLALSALMDIPEGLEVFVPVWQTLFLKLQETPSETLTGSAVAAVLRSVAGFGGAAGRVGASVVGGSGDFGDVIGGGAEFVAEGDAVLVSAGHAHPGTAGTRPPLGSLG